MKPYKGIIILKYSTEYEHFKWTKDIEISKHECEIRKIDNESYDSAYVFRFEPIYIDTRSRQHINLYCKELFNDVIRINIKRKNTSGFYIVRFTSDNLLFKINNDGPFVACLLYTSPSQRD